jgi:gluconate 2-dehydrogenase gamma chain
MAEEHISNQRRRFLRHAIGAVPAAAMLGGAAGLVSNEAANAQTTAVAVNGYAPTYFNPDEWAFINAAVDRLIPSNEDGPGGIELGVSQFIDKQMETGYGHGELWYLHGPFYPDSDFTLGYQLRYTPRHFYRAAIADINAFSQKEQGKNFSDLDTVAQDKVLGQLEKGSIDLPNVKSIEFFIQLLANTKEGYFADPMYGGNLNMASWKMIGFPGARADFKDWLAQPGTVYPLGPVSIEGEKA